MRRGTLCGRTPRRRSNACNRRRTNVAPSDGRPRIGTVLLGWGAGAFLLASAGCASTTVTRVDTASVTDLSGHWNDADSRLVAEEMVKEALSGPWLDTYTGANKRRPVVVGGTRTNRSPEHINGSTSPTTASLGSARRRARRSWNGSASCSDATVRLVQTSHTSVHGTLESRPPSSALRHRRIRLRTRASLCAY